jgi:hypothetical protein
MRRFLARTMAHNKVRVKAQRGVQYNLHKNQTMRESGKEPARLSLRRAEHRWKPAALA